MQTYAVVVAAGTGARMKSRNPNASKYAFSILGKPMIGYVLDSLTQISVEKTVVVTGYGEEETRKACGNCSDFVHQASRNGVGDAVLCAFDSLKGKKGEVLILSGDMPLLEGKTLVALLSSHRTNQAELSVLTASFSDPTGYGRIIKKDGRIVKIVEQKDCSIEEEAIHEVNAGVYVADCESLFASLLELKEENKDGYLPFTDLIARLAEKGKRINSFSVTDPLEAMRVNDRYQLSLAEKTMQMRINKKWMLSGVSIMDMESTYIGPDVEIGADSEILPGCLILGKTSIGCYNRIGPNSFIDSCRIGDGNRIEYSHLVDSEVKNDSVLGPYLRVRGNSIVGDNVLLGNFNELKNASIGKGTFCSHLSYLGDVSVGENVNIGCGVIVANYDGVNKTHSEIGNNAFVGSGSIVISPMSVGESSFVAAGSVVNKDVPPHALAIARQRQENKEGYADVVLGRAKKKYNQ